MEWRLLNWMLDFADFRYSTSPSLLHHCNLISLHQLLVVLQFGLLSLFCYVSVMLATSVTTFLSITHDDS